MDMNSNTVNTTSAIVATAKEIGIKEAENWVGPIEKTLRHHVFFPDYFYEKKISFYCGDHGTGKISFITTFEPDAQIVECNSTDPECIIDFIDKLIANDDGASFKAVVINANIFTSAKLVMYFNKIGKLGYQFTHFYYDIKK